MSAESLHSLVDALRVGVDPDSFDVEVQQLYERWLKRETWLARTELLPLVVGVDPDGWQSRLDSRDLGGPEQALWQRYQAEADIESENSAVDVAAAVTFFRRNDVVLPASFTRLYDFIRQTTLVTQPSGSSDESAAARERAGEREIVLGAALALVAGMPDRCRDEHGFVEGAIVARLILQSAARWFPAQAPSLSEAEMAALIDKWLE